MKTLTFILIAFVWSWAWWFLGLHYIAHGLNDQSFGGLAEFGTLLKRALIWRGPWYVYLFVFLLPFVCTGSAICLYAQFSGSPGKVDLQGGLALIPIVLWSALRGGPLGEETGWRGFLLPELQKRYSAVISALIISVIWFAWHIPLFFAPVGTAVSGQPVTVISVSEFLAFVLCLSCIYTWVFNRSGGSLLLSILIHWSINASLLMLFFPQLANEHGRSLTLYSLPVYVLVAAFLTVRTKLK